MLHGNAGRGRVRTAAAAALVLIGVLVPAGSAQALVDPGGGSGGPGITYVRADAAPPSGWAWRPAPCGYAGWVGHYRPPGISWGYEAYWAWGHPGASDSRVYWTFPWRSLPARQWVHLQMNIDTCNAGTHRAYYDVYDGNGARRSLWIDQGNTSGYYDRAPDGRAVERWPKVYTGDCGCLSVVLGNGGTSGQIGASDARVIS